MAARTWPELRTKDIHDIRTWPPGSFMVYDNTKLAMRDPHVGLGIVVANDGADRIRVVWGSNCRDPYLEYTVSTLNRAVIRLVE